MVPTHDLQMTSKDDFLGNHLNFKQLYLFFVSKKALHRGNSIEANSVDSLPEVETGACHME